MFNHSRFHKCTDEELIKAMRHHSDPDVVELCARFIEKIDLLDGQDEIDAEIAEALGCPRYVDFTTVIEAEQARIEGEIVELQDTIEDLESEIEELNQELKEKEKCLTIN